MKSRTVRIFLDSNVILSGLLSDRGAPRIILDIACLEIPFISVLTGQYNIIEIERNLTRKLPQALPVYQKYLSKLNMEIIPLPEVDAVKKASQFMNAKDAPVVASAVLGCADYLVTGDRKDFSRLKKSRKYPFDIVTPAELLEVLFEGMRED